MTWLGALAALLRRAPAWLLGALGALTALALAYLRGRTEGSARERSRATEAALDRKSEAESLEREVDGLSASELDQRGEPWVRR